MTGRAKIIMVAVFFFMLGCLVTPQLPFLQAQDNATKKPKWMHALTLKCRKSTEEDFTKDTKGFGIEVFKDENNGNLIYISETGSISVVAGK